MLRKEEKWKHCYLLFYKLQLYPFLRLNIGRFIEDIFKLIIIETSEQHYLLS